MSGGGSVRALNVWKMIEEIYNDVVVSYALASDSKQIEIDGLVEKHIGKPLLLRNVSGGYLCAFPSSIKRKLCSANIFESVPSVVILEGPYLGYAVLKTIGIPETSTVIYDAQNIEVNYHKYYFNKNPIKKLILNKIASIEKKVMNESHFILSTSDEECKILEDTYHQTREKIILVPNGVDTDTIKPLNIKQKLSLRGNASIKTPIAIFMGSGIEANIVAGRWISEYLAKKSPEVTFFIIGNVCEELQVGTENVKLLGRLPNSKKNEMLQIADVTINPVQFGAGTNVKMLEYLAAALPIVSTNIGIRGLFLNDRKEVLVSELQDFHIRIREILKNESLQDLLSKSGRRRAEHYNWKNIAISVKNRLNQESSVSRTT